MPKNAQSYIIIGRHATRVRANGRKPSKLYPIFTDGGVKIVQKNLWQKISRLIDNTEDGAVVMLGGYAGESRTKTTLQIYTDLLFKTYGKKKGCATFELPSWPKDLGEIKKILQENPEGKILLSLPILIPYWSRYPDFYKRDGNKTAFQQALHEKTGYSDSDTELWFRHANGLYHNNKYFKGPEPRRVAEKMMRGLGQTIRKIRKLIGPKQLVFICVGTGKKLDALSVYLSNNGRANYSGFRKMGNQKIQYQELRTIKNDGENALFTCRNQTYKLSPQLTKSLN